MLQQMAAVAELEAGLISMRTKAALAAAKARGVKLGGDRGQTLDDTTRAAGRAARTAHAQSRADDLAPTIRDLQAAGATSLRDIAKGLAERGIGTARGGSDWTSAQVARAGAHRLKENERREGNISASAVISRSGDASFLACQAASLGSRARAAGARYA